MLWFVLRNPHLGTSNREDKEILASASKTSLPTSNSPVLQQGRTYKRRRVLVLQPSQEMEPLLEPENTENPEQPDRTLML